MRQRPGRRVKEAEPNMATVLDAAASVRFLRRKMGLTEADLADGTGASTRTVRRWIVTTRPQARYAQRIDDLKTVVDELQDSMTPKGIRQWLRARNRYLDDARPIDLLRDGQFDRVKEA